MVKETLGLLSDESVSMVVQFSLIILSNQYILQSVVVDMVEGSLCSNICESMFLNSVSTVSRFYEDCIEKSYFIVPLDITRGEYCIVSDFPHILLHFP